MNRTFIFGGLAAMVALWGLLFAGNLRLAGEALSVEVQDVGEAVCAFGAAAGCAYASLRSRGRMRVGWALFGVSALAWSAGQVVWSVYEIGLEDAVPFPSAADVGFMSAIPLAVAAVLCFPSGPSRAINRARLVLDAQIVALSLLFVAWAVVLAGLFSKTADTAPAGVLALVYPTADVFVISLLAMTVRRASAGFRVALVLLLLAYVANLLADSSFAYLQIAGRYGLLGSPLDTFWAVGYLGIGLAALWPERRSAAAAGEESPEVWELLMPWLAILAVILTTAWIAIANRNVGIVSTWIGTALGPVFVGSQIIALSDSLHLLVRSRRTEAELRERSSLLAEIIGRAPLGIARLDGDLRFLDVNAALCSMLAAPAEALLGTSMYRYLSSEETAAVAERVKRMSAGELTRVEVDSEMHCADGRKIWVHRSVMPVLKERGGLAYFLVMFEDMTAKHDNEEAAKANLAASERLNRLKSEFMSMVSHEFRTALTGIQGYSEVLSTEEVPPKEVKQFASDINSDALRLNRMITEMLDLDRIESGRIQLHPEPLDLNELLRAAADRARITTSKHQITTNLDANLPRVDGDRDRLTEVLSNLLSNAVKYSPRGGEIVVTSRVADGNVEVTVRDQGQGIPPEFIGRIFGRYERYEGAGKTRVVGTGLGLAITQQIIQLHRGRIWVDSVLGAGSEFHFTIPVSAGSEAQKVA